MSKIKYLMGFIAVFFMSACTDFVDPAIPYSDFETGVFLRTLENKSGTINFFDLASGKFSIVVEAVDIEEGKLVKDVEVYVSRRRGPAVTPEKLIKTLQASDFKPNPNRNFPLAPNRNFPAAEITITTPESLAALGLTTADVNGGDFFEYRLVLNTTDGRKFTNTNLSGDISGGNFYRSPFFYRIAVVCPSALAGTYNSITTGTSTDGCCPGATTVESTVTLTVGSVPTNYTISDFSAGLYKKWYEVYGINDAYLSSKDPATNKTIGTIIDACGNISGSWLEPFGESLTITGMKISGENKITYEWVNGYGDKATVTLTKQ